MPQIDAPTVAEHRAQQREALLDAAERSCSRRATGRSRSAAGRADRAGAQLDLPLLRLARRPDRRALRARHAALAGGARDRDGRRRATATRASRRSCPRSCGSSPTAATGWPQLLGDAPLGPAVRARINALAYRPAALLEPELGADAQLTAQLIQGVVNAGVRLLHGAGTLEEVEPLTVDLAQTLVPLAGGPIAKLMTGFAELPQRIAALTREHERVAVVLLDAFGMAFVERHADHPFLRRLEIEPVTSQFPSTTTAHLSTLYTGLPVEQHGLYEWQIYEPRTRPDHPAAAVRRRATATPLRSTRATLLPGPTLFEQLDVPRWRCSSTAIWPSRYGSAAFVGAEVEAFEQLERGDGAARHRARA